MERPGALIAEDSVLVLMMLTRALEHLGITVVAAVETVAEALAWADQPAITLAILDVHLRDQEVFPVADRLLARQVPLVLITGADPHSLPERLRSLPLVPKPFDTTDVLAAVVPLLFPPR